MEIAPSPRRPAAAVVLAAGESSRLGVFKPLLPWPGPEDGEPLVAYQVRQLLAAGATPVLVVTGRRAAEVAAAARAAGGEAVFNPHHQEGKATSVHAGVAAAPEGAGLLIVGVDQPRPAWLYRRLIEASAAGAPIVLPGHTGRRGHPPLFGPALRDELLAVREESFGLRAVVQRHAAATLLLDVGSPLALVNLNTPADLAAARALAR